MKRIIFAVALMVALPNVAVAQNEPVYGLNPFAVGSTILYGLLGIALCVLGYFAFDRIAGLDLKRELVEDQNIALGIMLAGVFIGIAIVVSAAITG